MAGFDTAVHDIITGGNYDPNEARDSHGRWVKGFGALRAVVGELLKSGKIDKAQYTATMKASARHASLGRGIPHADVTDHAKTLQYIAQTLRHDSQASYDKNGKGNTEGKFLSRTARAIENVHAALTGKPRKGPMAPVRHPPVHPDNIGAVLEPPKVIAKAPGKNKPALAHKAPGKGKPVVVAKASDAAQKPPEALQAAADLVLKLKSLQAGEAVTLPNGNTVSKTVDKYGTTYKLQRPDGTSHRSASETSVARIAHGLSPNEQTPEPSAAAKADAAKMEAAKMEAAKPKVVSQGGPVVVKKANNGITPGIEALQARHPEVEMHIGEFTTGPYAHAQHIRLSMIKTLGDKNKGKAGAAMRDLTAYADEKGLLITLTPEPVGKGGMSKTTLVKWYKARGFRSNLGSKADHRFSETMIREPDPAMKAKLEQAAIDKRGHVLVMAAEKTHTLDAFKTIHDAAYGHDEPGSVADALGLDNIRGDTVDEQLVLESASRQIQEASQNALSREGVNKGDTMTVYREPVSSGDSSGVVSVSTRPLTQFKNQQQYTISRSDVLTYGNGLLPQGSFDEHELQVEAGVLEPVVTPAKPALDKSGKKLKVGDNVKTPNDEAATITAIEHVEGKPWLGQSAYEKVTVKYDTTSSANTDSYMSDEVTKSTGKSTSKSTGPKVISKKGGAPLPWQLEDPRPKDYTAAEQAPFEASLSTAREFAKANFDTATPTSEEAQALRAYQFAAASGPVVNQELRAVRPNMARSVLGGDDTVHTVTTGIDSLMERSKSSRSVTVFRGVSHDLGNLQVGQRISDPGYLSTSLRVGMANNSLTTSGDTPDPAGRVMQITIPKGSPSIAFDNVPETQGFQASEILLPRDTTLRVDSVEPLRMTVVKANPRAVARARAGRRLAGIASAVKVVARQRQVKVSSANLKPGDIINLGNVKMHADTWGQYKTVKDERRVLQVRPDVGDKNKVIVNLSPPLNEELRSKAGIYKFGKDKRGPLEGVVYHGYRSGYQHGGVVEKDERSLTMGVKGLVTVKRAVEIKKGVGVKATTQTAPQLHEYKAALDEAMATATGPSDIEHLDPAHRPMPAGHVAGHAQQVLYDMAYGKLKGVKQPIVKSPQQIREEHAPALQAIADKINAETPHQVEVTRLRDNITGKPAEPEWKEAYKGTIPRGDYDSYSGPVEFDGSIRYEPSDNIVNLSGSLQAGSPDDYAGDPTSGYTDPYIDPTNPSHEAAVESAGLARAMFLTSTPRPQTGGQVALYRGMWHAEHPDGTLQEWMASPEAEAEWQRTLQQPGDRRYWMEKAQQRADVRDQVVADKTKEVQNDYINTQLGAHIPTLTETRAKYADELQALADQIKEDTPYVVRVPAPLRDYTGERTPIAVRNLAYKAGDAFTDPETGKTWYAVQAKSNELPESFGGEKFVDDGGNQHIFVQGEKLSPGVAPTLEPDWPGVHPGAIPNEMTQTDSYGDGPTATTKLVELKPVDRTVDIKGLPDVTYTGTDGVERAAYLSQTISTGNRDPAVPEVRAAWHAEHPNASYEDWLMSDAANKLWEKTLKADGGYLKVWKQVGDDLKKGRLAHINAKTDAAQKEFIDSKRSGAHLTETELRERHASELNAIDHEADAGTPYRIKVPKQSGEEDWAPQKSDTTGYLLNLLGVAPAQVPDGAASPYIVARSAPGTDVSEVAEGGTDPEFQARAQEIVALPHDASSEDVHKYLSAASNNAVVQSFRATWHSSHPGTSFDDWVASPDFTDYYNKLHPQGVYGNAGQLSSAPRLADKAAAIRQSWVEAKAEPLKRAFINARRNPAMMTDEQLREVHAPELQEIRAKHEGAVPYRFAVRSGPSASWSDMHDFTVGASAYQPYVYENYNGGGQIMSSKNNEPQATNRIVELPPEASPEEIHQYLMATGGGNDSIVNKLRTEYIATHPPGESAKFSDFVKSPEFQKYYDDRYGHESGKMGSGPLQSVAAIKAVRDMAIDERAQGEQDQYLADLRKSVKSDEEYSKEMAPQLEKVKENIDKQTPFTLQMTRLQTSGNRPSPIPIQTTNLKPGQYITFVQGGGGSHEVISNDAVAFEAKSAQTGETTMYQHGIVGGGQVWRAEAVPEEPQWRGTYEGQYPVKMSSSHPEQGNGSSPGEGIYVLPSTTSDEELLKHLYATADQYGHPALAAARYEWHLQHPDATVQDWMNSPEFNNRYDEAQAQRGIMRGIPPKGLSAAEREKWKADNIARTDAMTQSEYQRIVSEGSKLAGMTSTRDYRKDVRSNEVNARYAEEEKRLINERRQLEGAVRYDAGMPTWATHSALEPQTWDDINKRAQGHQIGQTNTETPVEDYARAINATAPGTDSKSIREEINKRVSDGVNSRTAAEQVIEEWRQDSGLTGDEANASLNALDAADRTHSLRGMSNEDYVDAIKVGSPMSPHQIRNDLEVINTVQVLSNEPEYTTGEAARQLIQDYEIRGEVSPQEAQMMREAVQRSEDSHILQGQPTPPLSRYIEAVKSVKNEHGNPVVFADKMDLQQRMDPSVYDESFATTFGGAARHLVNEIYGTIDETPGQYPQDEANKAKVLAAIDQMERGYARERTAARMERSDVNSVMQQALGNRWRQSGIMPSSGYSTGKERAAKIGSAIRDYMQGGATTPYGIRGDHTSIAELKDIINKASDPKTSPLIDADRNDHLETNTRKMTLSDLPEGSFYRMASGNTGTLPMSPGSNYGAIPTHFALPGQYKEPEPLTITPEARDYLLKEVDRGVDQWAQAHPEPAQVYRDWVPTLHTQGMVEDGVLYHSQVPARLNSGKLIAALDEAEHQANLKTEASGATEPDPLTQGELVGELHAQGIDLQDLPSTVRRAVIGAGPASHGFTASSEQYLDPHSPTYPEEAARPVGEYVDLPQDNITSAAGDYRDLLQEQFDNDASYNPATEQLALDEAKNIAEQWRPGITSPGFEPQYKQDHDKLARIAELQAKLDDVHAKRAAVQSKIAQFDKLHKVVVDAFKRVEGRERPVAVPPIDVKGIVQGALKDDNPITSLRTRISGLASVTPNKFGHQTSMTADQRDALMEAIDKVERATANQTATVTNGTVPQESDNAIKALLKKSGAVMTKNSKYPKVSGTWYDSKPGDMFYLGEGGRPLTDEEQATHVLSGYGGPATAKGSAVEELGHLYTNDVEGGPPKEPNYADAIKTTPGLSQKTVDSVFRDLYTVHDDWEHPAHDYTPGAGARRLLDALKGAKEITPEQHDAALARISDMEQTRADIGRARDAIAEMDDKWKAAQTGADLLEALHQHKLAVSHLSDLVNHQWKTLGVADDGSTDGADGLYGLGGLSAKGIKQRFEEKHARAEAALEAASKTRTGAVKRIEYVPWVQASKDSAGDFGEAPRSQRGRLTLEGYTPEEATAKLKELGIVGDLEAQIPGQAVFRSERRVGDIVPLHPEYIRGEAPQPDLNFLLAHGLTDSEADNGTQLDQAKRILNSGGLMSIRDRWVRGIRTNTSSQAGDIGSGIDHVVFAFMNSGSTCGSASGIRVALRPEAVMRRDVMLAPRDDGGGKDRYPFYNGYREKLEAAVGGEVGKSNLWAPLPPAARQAHLDAFERVRKRGNDSANLTDEEWNRSAEFNLAHQIRVEDMAAIAVPDQPTMTAVQKHLMMLLDSGLVSRIPDVVLSKDWQMIIEMEG